MNGSVRALAGPGLLLLLAFWLVAPHVHDIRVHGDPIGQGRAATAQQLVDADAFQSCDLFKCLSQLPAPAFPGPLLIYEVGYADVLHQIVEIPNLSLLQEPIRGPPRCAR